ncbi:MAG TPA: CNNM domain-containing protein [Pirellulaceae bacterium]|nr:CNNM domain-containing protein [Pirellulaceae bacterium]HMO91303.1 CNNM domain-containing protein [Pirellulaceae bacterium]HMP68513.1 CNNM domain-containing protein [Pirellulaceae bacterium]
MLNALWELTPYLVAMLILIGCSGFFSASEASLFSLRPQDRRSLATGKAADRTAAKLLRDPNRLLSAVLFWNLVVNVTYFAIGSICTLNLERRDDIGTVSAGLFAMVTLILLIFFSELLPKTFAVLNPRGMSRLVSVPLSIAVRLTDPIMPVLQSVQRFSRRLIWPGLKPEKYLEVADLERAILLGSHDAAFIEQEQAVLQNVVHLSDIRIDEWMRPRTQIKVLKPPITFESLNREFPANGYLFIAEPKNEEIARFIHVDELRKLPPDANLDQYAERVLYLPWNSTVADALEKMAKRDHQVVVAVNEYGDGVGVLTMDDLLESIFAFSPGRTTGFLEQVQLRKIGEHRWLVSGMMSLKRLARKLHVEFPETFSVTVAGIIEEVIQRVMQEGDECEWGPLHFRVLHATTRAEAEIEVSLSKHVEQTS